MEVHDKRSVGWCSSVGCKIYWVYLSVVLRLFALFVCVRARVAYVSIYFLFFLPVLNTLLFVLSFMLFAEDKFVLSLDSCRCVTSECVGWEHAWGMKWVGTQSGKRVTFQGAIVTERLSLVKLCIKINTPSTT